MYRKLFFFFLIAWSTGLKGQIVQIGFPDTTVAPTTTVGVPIVVSQFEDIVSAQFSIHWDTEVITYLGEIDGDLPNVAIGATDSANGVLRFSWFDVEGDGASLADGANAHFLQFMAVGNVGSSTPVTIDGEPLAIQIFKVGDTPNMFDPVDLEYTGGSVAIGTSINIDLMITDVSCQGDTTGAISITLPDSLQSLDREWSGPFGFSSTQEDLTDLVAGGYTLIIRDEDGAIVFEELIVVNEPLPLEITSVDAQDSNCNEDTGSAFILTSGGTPGYFYDIGADTTSTNSFGGLAPGDYGLTVTDAAGCVDSTSFSIAAPDPPVFDLPALAAICPGEDLLLDTDLSAVHAWSTGESSSSIMVSVPGTYSVTVTTENNCARSDTVTVISGADIELELLTPFLDICPGDSLQLEVDGAITYTWIDTSGTLLNPNVNNPVAFPDFTSAYQVIGATDCGADTLSVVIEVYPVVATAGPDTCIAPDQPARLRASGGIDYEWISFGAPVSDSSIPNPETMPSEDANYVVRIIDEFGCITVDSMLVGVVRDLSGIVPVNTITPNGDGKNDVLEFPNIGKFNVNTLKVYNRWGDLLYNKVNYMSDDGRFDGTWNDSPLPAGTYYYVLSFSVGDIKSALLIIRE